MELKFIAADCHSKKMIFQTLYILIQPIVFKLFFYASNKHRVDFMPPFYCKNSDCFIAFFDDERYLPFFKDCHQMVPLHTHQTHLIFLKETTTLRLGLKISKYQINSFFTFCLHSLKNGQGQKYQRMEYFVCSFKMHKRAQKCIWKVNISDKFMLKLLYKMSILVNRLASIYFINLTLHWTFYWSPLCDFLALSQTLIGRWYYYAQF